MKPTSTAFAVLFATLSACGAADATYVGELRTLTDGVDGPRRSTSTVEIELIDGQGQWVLGGLVEPLAVTREGDQLTIEARGKVLGGLGTLTGGRLSFTVLTFQGEPTPGFTTFSFEGVSGHEVAPSMTQQVSVGRAPEQQMQSLSAPPHTR